MFQAISEEKKKGAFFSEKDTHAQVMSRAEILSVGSRASWDTTRSH